MRSERSGFTIVEAIASLVILAVSVPPMLWAVQQSHVFRADQTMASRARWLASEQLENIIADRHSSSRGYGFLVLANYPAEASIAGWPGFSREVVFTATGPDLQSPGADYVTVTCIVRYSDVRGVTRAVTISTVLTDYQP